MNNTRPQPRGVTLMGVPLDPLTSAQACDYIEAALAERRGGWVLTPNVDILRRLVLDRSFAATCAGVDLRLADGAPLIWASWLRGTPLPARVSGSGIIYPLCESAARHGRRVFLLGGNPGTAEASASRLCGLYSNLRIAGTHCPPFGFERDPAEVDRIRRVLIEAHPDLVFVGLGSPKQERLIHDLREVLSSAWFVGLGITFSFVSGELRRAPVWMRRAGLEWTHRLMQEPRRLAKRYLVHGVPFAARLLAVSAWEGVFGL